MDKHSLFELNEFVRRIIAINLPDSIWVSGEIMQCNKSRGHFYIELIEKDKVTQQISAQAQAVLWAGTYYQLKRKIGKDLDNILQAGMQVLLKVKVDFNERYGLKLIIESVDTAFTLGQMELKRRTVIQQLQKEKAFKKNKALELPIVVQRLAVISSQKAAGFKDFEQHLVQNPYGYQFQIQLYHTAMQGQFVEQEVVKALQQIALSKTQYDVIVIIRGGGSKLDLSGFDSLKLCQHIALSPLPILTGIGHEIDKSIADLVAHTALKTPTAVASFLLESMVTFESTLNQQLLYIKDMAQQQLQESHTTLQNLQQTLLYQSNTLINRQHQMLDYIKTELPKLSRNLLKQQQQQLNFLEKTCYLLSPELALKRGFSITRINGKAISSVQEVKTSDTLTTVLHDGTINSKVL